MCECFCTLRSPRPHRSSSCWHHPVPGVINSAHLENHLADGQWFSVLCVNVFAHLGVRNPLSRARRRLPKANLSNLSGIFCGVENLSLPLSRHSILSGATNPWISSLWHPNGAHVRQDSRSIFLCIEDKIYIVTKNYKWAHLKKCHLPLFTPYRSIFEAQVFQNTTISSGLNLKKSVGSASFELSQPQVTKISQSLLVFQVIFLGLLRSCFELFVWRLRANSSPAAHLKEHFKQFKTASK